MMLVFLLLLPRVSDGASMAKWLDKSCGTAGDISQIGSQCVAMPVEFCQEAGSSSVQYSCDGGIMTKTEFRDTQGCGADLPESCVGLPLPCTTQDEVEALVVCVALRRPLIRGGTRARSSLSLARCRNCHPCNATLLPFPHSPSLPLLRSSPPRSTLTVTLTLRRYNNSGYQDQCIYFGPEDFRTFSCGPCAAFATTYSLALSVVALAVALRGPEWFTG